MCQQATALLAWTVCAVDVTFKAVTHRCEVQAGCPVLCQLCFIFQLFDLFGPEQQWARMGVGQWVDPEATGRLIRLISSTVGTLIISVCWRGTLVTKLSGPNVMIWVEGSRGRVPTDKRVQGLAATQRCNANYGVLSVNHCSRLQSRVAPAPGSQYQSAVVHLPTTNSAVCCINHCLTLLLLMLLSACLLTSPPWSATVPRATDLVHHGNCLSITEGGALLPVTRWGP